MSQISYNGLSQRHHARTIVMGGESTAYDIGKAQWIDTRSQAPDGHLHHAVARACSSVKTTVALGQWDYGWAADVIDEGKEANIELNA